MRSDVIFTLYSWLWSRLHWFFNSLLMLDRSRLLLDSVLDMRPRMSSSFSLVIRRLSLASSHMDLSIASRLLVSLEPDFADRVAPRHFGHRRDILSRLVVADIVVLVDGAQTV